jgi:peptide deformylase
LNLYNATIVKAEQPFLSKEEGCLSLPGVRCDVNRYNIITVKNGDGVETKYSGFDAIVIQHELDHWDGVIITDKQV